MARALPGDIDRVLDSIAGSCAVPSLDRGGGEQGSGGANDIKTENGDIDHRFSSTSVTSSPTVHPKRFARRRRHPSPNRPHIHGRGGDGSRGKACYRPFGSRRERGSTGSPGSSHSAPWRRERLDSSHLHQELLCRHRLGDDQGMSRSISPTRAPPLPAHVFLFLFFLSLSFAASHLLLTWWERSGLGEMASGIAASTATQDAMAL